MERFSVRPLPYHLLPGTHPFFLKVLDDPGARERHLGAEGWDAVHIRASARPRPLDGRVLAALEKLNPAAHPAVAESLEIARGPGGVACVLTGQQAGLFTGPLYAVYKAVTAVRLAADLRAAGTPAVAVFWVAGDDHDFHEAARACLMIPGSRAMDIRAPEPPAKPLPVGRVPLGEWVLGAVESAFAALPVSDHTAALREIWDASCRPEFSYSRSFAAVMGRLFAPSGLLLFDLDASDRGGVMGGFLEGFHSKLSCAVRAVREAEARLAEDGLHPQVAFRNDRPLLFFIHPELGRRRVVEESPGRFAVEGSEMRWVRGDWPGVVREHAARFSPDALLRPLLQDFLFPTAAYVAGPSEMAYHAQIGGLYPLWDIPRPAVYPRLSASVFRPGTLRRLRKMGLHPEDALSDRGRLVERVLGEAGHLGAEDEVLYRRKDVEASLGRFTGCFASLADDIARSAETTAGKIRDLLDKMEERLRRKIKSDHADLVDRVVQACEDVLPGGRPQERVANALPLLNSFGADFPLGLARIGDTGPASHQLVLVEGGA